MRRLRSWLVVPGLVLAFTLSLRLPALGQVGNFSNVAPGGALGSNLYGGGYYSGGYYNGGYYGGGFNSTYITNSYLANSSLASGYYGRYYGGLYPGLLYGSRYYGNSSSRFFPGVGYGYYGTGLDPRSLSPTAQQRDALQDPRVRQVAPIVLRPAPGDTTLPPHGTPRTLILRVYATKEYAAQNVAWREHFQQLIERINDRVETWPGVIFEIKEMHEWTPVQSEDNVEAVLAELEQRDAGSDVDWVVGLVTALPLLPSHVHNFGISRPLGHHMILRSLHELMEEEVLRKRLTGLVFPAERERLLEVHKLHKEEVIFLHEWGHALGALHVDEEHLIMNPTYSPLQSQLGPHTAHIMALALRERLALEIGDEWRDDAAPKLRAFITGPEEIVWHDQDREHLLAALDRFAPPPPKDEPVSPARADVPKPEIRLHKPILLLPPELIR